LICWHISAALSSEVFAAFSAATTDLFAESTDLFAESADFAAAVALLMVFRNIPSVTVR
jgi:hypothetical protein